MKFCTNGACDAVDLHGFILAQSVKAGQVTTDSRGNAYSRLSRSLRLSSLPLALRGRGPSTKVMKSGSL